MSTQKKFLDIQNLELYHSLILEEIRKNIQKVYSDLANTSTDTWSFKASYTGTSITISQVIKNNELYNGNLSVYATKIVNNTTVNMTCIIANKTFVNGSYTVSFSNNQSMIDFLAEADTIVFKLGPGSGGGQYEFYNASYTLPIKAAAIADGAHGFVTGDQLYDYIATLQTTIVALEARVADLEDQMTVENSSPATINDFSEIEPEDSSDYVITDYESEE